MGYLNLWGNELENFILAAYKKKKGRIRRVLLSLDR